VRILQIIDSFSYGGAERLLATLNSVAPDAGLDMSVTSLAPASQGRNASLPVLEAAGLRPAYADVHKLLDPQGIPKLVRAIRESGCEVVHAHLGTSATMVPVAARIAGVPCISTLHHLPRRKEQLSERVKNWLQIQSAERGHALVFVSDAARHAAAGLYRPHRSWRTLHNGVDLTAFNPVDGPPEPLPADIAAAVDVPPGAPVVSIVAAVREPKGHEYAIAAWPKVRAQVPDATLLVVGDGPHLPALRALVGADPDSGIAFTGAREDAPAILRASTLALLPSLTEALPTSLIEAAATGLAVVATTVGGTPETVEHGSTGILVAPRDAEAISTAVTDLLIDSGRRAQYGRAGRRLAEDRFDLRRWAERLADLYAEALGTDDRRRTRGSSEAIAKPEE
jgi:glycosyltransferase involved in cell wall biosynthesis